MRIDEARPGSRLRAQLVEKYAAAENRHAARGRPADHDTRSRSAAERRPTGPTYRCAGVNGCGQTFGPYAPAERHADTHHGARIEWLHV